MAKPTYYQLLGVEPDATHEELRKAYKQRAKDWHPDRPNGSPEKFKELVDAYDILKNADTRKAYDRKLNNSPENFTARFSSAASGAAAAAKKVMNDFVDEGLFDTLDKFLGRKREPRNIESSINITLEELYNGADKTVAFKRLETCDSCDGLGAESKSDVKICVDCIGLGQTVSTFAALFSKEDCKKCKGLGKIITKKCKACKGKGERKYQRDFTFPIPTDLNFGKDKDRLILPEEGEYGGDLIIAVDLKDHKYYEVKWPHLYIDLPIQFYQAILGDYLELETLRGSALFKIPQGTESGDTITLKGYGLRQTDKQGNTTLGNLYINVIVTVPKRVNKEQKQLLESYKALDRGRKKSKPIKK